MIFDLILVLGLACSTLTVTILYASIAPWWRSLTGKALMLLLVCMDIILGLSATESFTGDFPYLHGLARGAYILMIIAVLSFGAVMVQEQRRGRRRRALHKKQPTPDADPKL